MNKIKDSFFVTLIIFAILFLSSLILAQDDSVPQTPIPKLQRIAGINARFIVALISDGEGGVWIGTEDEGVFHCDVDNKVTSYTTKDGLGDNNGYALAIDKFGRLWVGNLNTGVSIFNGNTWKNYDVIDGPVGERVFDIKTCPVDGDVWIATSGGLSRYKINFDNWEHFSRDEGLLEEQVSSIAFDRRGNLFVGTRCHGLAIFGRDKSGNYSHVKNIVTYDRFGVGGCSPVPLEPMEWHWLPSNQINDLQIDRNGDLCIATSAGIARLVLGGKTEFLDKYYIPTISFIRGRDYANKVRGLWGGAPKDWKECSKEIMDQLLPEDYLTTLAVDREGTIWYGFRQNGAIAIDPETKQTLTVNNKSGGLSDNFVTKILPMPDGRHFFATYGGGIMRSSVDLRLQKRNLKPIKENIFGAMTKLLPAFYPPFPTSPKPLTFDELKKMEKKLDDQSFDSLPIPYAAYLGEDWKTQGDWTGRIYREWAIICATVSPFNHRQIFSSDDYDVNASLGPNHPGQKDNLRLYYRGENTNPKTLWNPSRGTRRQAEWDDHGEVYPWHLDGPDIWYLLEIKHKGTFRISMYFVNPDGHDGANRMRDYLIEFYPTDMKWEYQKESIVPPGSNEKPVIYGKDITPFIGRNGEALARQKPPFARCRVRNFWGGVHVQFIVTGPHNYLVKIDRNYSFNTIMSSVTVDQVFGEPTLFVKKHFGIPNLQQEPYDPPSFPKLYITWEGRQIDNNWHKLDNCFSFQGGIELQRKQRILLYQTVSRLANMHPNDKSICELAKTIKWRLNQWDEEQRKEWHEAMMRGWNKYYKHNIHLQRILKEEKKGVPPDVIKNRVPLLYD